MNKLISSELPFIHKNSFLNLNTYLVQDNIVLLKKKSYKVELFCHLSTVSKFELEV